MGSFLLPIEALREEIGVFITDTFPKYVPHVVNLAEAAGVSRTGVTMIENGKRNPTLLYCHVPTKALELDLSGLIKEAEPGD